jgi:MYXO-CTERM domain-containing protein
MRLISIVGLAAVAVQLGCSDSGVSLDQFPSAYAHALCAQNFKCCSGTDIGTNTMQDCLDNNTSSLQLLAGSISDGQSRGRVRYDKDKMKDCIDAVSKLTCDDWSTGFTMSSQPAICDQAVVALVGMGGACRADLECVSGNCQGEDAANNVDGTCAAADSSGLSCTTSNDCSPDFYCDSTTNACVLKKVTGAACSVDEECRTRCNSATAQCSCYAGCAVAGPVSPGLIGLAAVAALILLAGRRRRSA